MFQQVSADVYVMVDGDGTYPPQDVHKILAPVLAGEADMVIGSRLHANSRSEFRPLNRFGNRLFLKYSAAVSKSGSRFAVRLSSLQSQVVKSVPCSVEASKQRPTDYQSAATWYAWSKFSELDLETRGQLFQDSYRTRRVPYFEHLLALFVITNH